MMLMLGLYHLLLALGQVNQEVDEFGAGAQAYSNSNGDPSGEYSG